jgi:hypothetical protein
MLGETLESLWLEIKLDGSVKAGKYPVTVRFNAQADGALWAEQTAVIEVIDAELPEQSLTVTQWFYTDCLMNYYGTEAFDERHWQIIENYISRAVSGGINMILTPVFTPALDTYVGGERKTTQLVGIKRISIGDAYRYEFDFSKLERWIKLCKKLGVKKFEIAHFFTQWGAAHTPKIVAETEGYGEARANLSKERLFSWDTCDISYEGELEVKNHALPKVSFSSKLVTEGLGVVEAQLNAGLAQIAKEYADVDAAMKADDERRAAEAKAKQEAFEQAKKSLEDCKGKTADEGLDAAKSAGYSATFKDKSGADVTSDVEDSGNESDVHGAAIASVETLNLLGNYVAFTLDYAAPKA